MTPFACPIVSSYVARRFFEIHVGKGSEGSGAHRHLVHGPRLLNHEPPREGGDGEEDQRRQFRS